jgi:hypothetical protein
MYIVNKSVKSNCIILDYSFDRVNQNMFIRSNGNLKITLMMEAVRSSETYHNMYQTKRHNSPEDSHFQFTDFLGVKKQS